MFRLTYHGAVGKNGIQEHRSSWRGVAFRRFARGPQRLPEISTIRRTIGFNEMDSVAGGETPRGPFFHDVSERCPFLPGEIILGWSQRFFVTEMDYDIFDGDH